MTVALLGVGADSTNAGPCPPVDTDGRFEYIPIPEAVGPDGTTESSTYGTTALRHCSGTLAEYLDWIRPNPPDGPQLTDQDLVTWPLHHDPNFEVLTYGETESRPAYTYLLRTLAPGDIVAFYTGLRHREGDYRHRYIIGYFTVDQVHDCRAIDIAGESRPFSNLSRQARATFLHEHGANAHVKRHFATGTFRAGDGLVIVEGRSPGGRLRRAERISTHRGGGHHYLSDRAQSLLDPVPGGHPERNAHLGGVKPPHECRCTTDRFRDFVGRVVE